MSRDALKTYLNDHLAGSVLAIELAERTIRENEGGPVAARLSPLVKEILEDQTVLKGLIERLATGESSVPWPSATRSFEGWTWTSSSAARWSSTTRWKRCGWRRRRRRSELQSPSTAARRSRLSTRLGPGRLKRRTPSMT